MAEIPEALEVVLRKLHPLAPPFHRHIASSKLVGSVCCCGDRIVVYEVAETVPSGRVYVSPKTVLRFLQP